MYVSYMQLLDLIDLMGVNILMASPCIYASGCAHIVSWYSCFNSAQRVGACSKLLQSRAPYQDRLEQYVSSLTPRTLGPALVQVSNDRKKYESLYNATNTVVREMSTECPTLFRDLSKYRNLSKGRDLSRLGFINFTSNDCDQILKLNFHQKYKYQGIELE